MRKKIEEKKWRDILSDISENVTEVSYRSWFDPLVPMITFILFLPTPGFRYQTEINPAIPFYTVPAALWIPSV